MGDRCRLRCDADPAYPPQHQQVPEYVDFDEEIEALERARRSMDHSNASTAEADDGEVPFGPLQGQQRRHAGDMLPRERPMERLPPAQRPSQIPMLRRDPTMPARLRQPPARGRGAAPGQQRGHAGDMLPLQRPMELPPPRRVSGMQRPRRPPGWRPCPEQYPQYQRPVPRQARREPIDIPELDLGWVDDEEATPPLQRHPEPRTPDRAEQRYRGQLQAPQAEPAAPNRQRPPRIMEGEERFQHDASCACDQPPSYPGETRDDRLRRHLEDVRPRDVQGDERREELRRNLAMPPPRNPPLTRTEAVAKLPPAGTTIAGFPPNARGHVARIQDAMRKTPELQATAGLPPALRRRQPRTPLTARPAGLPAAAGRPQAGGSPRPRRQSAPRPAARISGSPGRPVGGRPLAGRQSAVRSRKGLPSAAGGPPAGDRPQPGRQMAYGNNDREIVPDLWSQGSTAYSNASTAEADDGELPFGPLQKNAVNIPGRPQGRRPCPARYPPDQRAVPGQAPKELIDFPEVDWGWDEDEAVPPPLLRRQDPRIPDRADQQHRRHRGELPPVENVLPDFPNEQEFDNMMRRDLGLPPLEGRQGVEIPPNYPRAEQAAPTRQRGPHIREWEEGFQDDANCACDQLPSYAGETRDDRLRRHLENARHSDARSDEMRELDRRNVGLPPPRNPLLTRTEAVAKRPPAGTTIAGFPPNARRHVSRIQQAMIETPELQATAGLPPALRRRQPRTPMTARPAGLPAAAGRPPASDRPQTGRQMAVGPRAELPAAAGRPVAELPAVDGREDQGPRRVIIQVPIPPRARPRRRVDDTKPKPKPPFRN